MIRHGHAIKGHITSTWRTWKSMRARCHDPRNASYKYYGGKGVSVCERWQSFENFLADMGERPDGTTIDRLDGTVGYEPGNCRWATPSEQSQNLSSNKLTAKEALEIAARARAGEDTAALAQEFGVYPTMVRSIRSGKKWTSVVGRWKPANDNTADIRSGAWRGDQR